MQQFYRLRGTMVLLALACATYLTAADITVTSTANDGDGSLRQAIMMASSGDIILFDDDLNGRKIMLSSGIDVNKNLTIRGNGMMETIISGTASGRVFSVDQSSTVTIEDLMIFDGMRFIGGGMRIRSGSTVTLNNVQFDHCAATGDRADQGGGAIYNQGTLTINGSLFTNNFATGTSGSGGSIFNFTDATLTINNSSFLTTAANRAGGAIEDISGAATDFIITNSRFSDNMAASNPGNGGGIHIGSDGGLTISESSVNNCMAAAEGGAIWIASGTLNVMDTEIDNNRANGDDPDQGGGGIYSQGGGTVNISMDTRITGNFALGTSGSGGGVFNGPGATLNVENTMIVSNDANRAGGGIEDASGSTSMVTITDSRISENVVFNAPGNGGGVHVGGDGNLMITGGSVSDNTAGAEGGGLWNNTGTMTVSSVRLDDNVAQGDDADQGGGGIYNNGGTLIVNEGTVVTDNIASGAAGSGGGILNNVGGTLRLDSAIIDGNEANRAGGGIEDVSGNLSQFVILNSRIFGNVVNTSPGNGGGIHITGNGDLTVSETNFSKNIAGAEGGGLWNGSGTMSIDGCTISNNQALGDAADQGGGGIFNLSGIVILGNNTIVRENIASGASGSGGGLLSMEGVITVDGGAFRENMSNRAGGAVEIVDGTYESINTDYVANMTGAAPGNGGAFHVTGMNSLIDLSGGLMVRNSAANEGGALWNQSGSVMNITDVDIINNSVTGAGTAMAMTSGGGIYNNGGLIDIQRTTIARNTVSNGEFTNGGGIGNAPEGELSISNSTISTNSTAGSGGGIASAGEVEFDNVTIALNEAENGGGYFQTAAMGATAPMLTTTETAYSDNSASTSGNDILIAGGTVTNNGFNLVSNDDQGDFPEMGTDIEGQSANFGPLTDNGGTTLTHEPECPSPVIDAGDPNSMDTDQINQAVFGGTRDIGAFEKQETCPSNSPIFANFDQQAENKSAKEEMNVYPNVVSGNQTTVTIPARFGDHVSLRLIDGNGRVLSRRTVAAGRQQLWLEDYTNGTYILQAVSGEQVSSKRFIINR